MQYFVDGNNCGTVRVQILDTLTRFERRVRIDISFRTPNQLCLPNSIWTFNCHNCTFREVLEPTISLSSNSPNLLLFFGIFPYFPYFSNHCFGLFHGFSFFSIVFPTFVSFFSRLCHHMCPILLRLPNHDVITYLSFSYVTSFITSSILTAHL